MAAGPGLSHREFFLSISIFLVQGPGPHYLVVLSCKLLLPLSPVCFRFLFSGAPPPPFVLTTSIGSCSSSAAAIAVDVIQKLCLLTKAVVSIEYPVFERVTSLTYSSLTSLPALDSWLSVPCQFHVVMHDIVLYSYTRTDTWKLAFCRLYTYFAKGARLGAPMSYVRMV